jgi:hypothetical protein
VEKPRNGKAAPVPRHQRIKQGTGWSICKQLVLKNRGRIARNKLAVGATAAIVLAILASLIIATKIDPGPRLFLIFGPLLQEPQKALINQFPQISVLQADDFAHLITEYDAIATYPQATEASQFRFECFYITSIFGQ